MKKSILFYLFLLIISCNPNSTDQNPEGTYTCRFEHEFAKTEDTLLLSRINGNYFKITRHSGVIKKRDSNSTSKIIIDENWKLGYDANTKLFTEIKTGKTLLWHSDKQVLILGNREYVKINK